MDRCEKIEKHEVTLKFKSKLEMERVVKFLGEQGFDFKIGNIVDYEITKWTTVPEYDD